MRHPIYELQLRMSRPLLEPEERDDAVDVDCQQRPVSHGGEVYQR
jgi:hypothetical protein